MRYKLLWFIVFISAGVLSCRKEFSFNTGGINPEITITDSTLFFDITIDGKNEKQVSVQGGESVIWWGTSSHTVNKPNFFDCGINKNSNLSGLELKRGPVYITSNDFDTSLQQVVGKFAPANYAYTDALTNDGVVLRWQDASGKEWGTDFGTGDQTGSIFSITQTVSGYTGGHIHGLIITASFKCRLYDKNGNSKQLDNGRLRFSFWL